MDKIQSTTATQPKGSGGINYEIPMTNNPVYNKIPQNITSHQDQEYCDIPTTDSPAYNQVSLTTSGAVTSSDTQHYDTPETSAAIGGPDYMEVLSINTVSFNKIPPPISDGTYETPVVQVTSCEIPIVTTTTDTGLVNTNNNR